MISEKGLYGSMYSAPPKDDGMCPFCFWAWEASRPSSECTMGPFCGYDPDRWSEPVAFLGVDTAFDDDRALLADWIRFERAFCFLAGAFDTVAE